MHNFAFVFADPDNRDLVVSFGKLNSSTVHYFLSTAKCGRFKGQLLATLKRQPKKVWPLRVSLFNVCRMYSAIITGKIACEWQRSIMFNFFFSFLFFVGYQQFDLEFSNFIYFIFYFFALISTLSFAELFPLLLCRTKCLFIYIYNFFKKTMTITKEWKNRKQITQSRAGRLHRQKSYYRWGLLVSFFFLTASKWTALFFFRRDLKKKRVYDDSLGECP